MSLNKVIKFIILILFNAIKLIFKDIRKKELNN